MDDSDPSDRELISNLQQFVKTQDAKIHNLNNRMIVLEGTVSHLVKTQVKTNGSLRSLQVGN